MDLSAKTHDFFLWESDDQAAIFGAFFCAANHGSSLPDGFDWLKLHLLSAAMEDRTGDGIIPLVPMEPPGIGRLPSHYFP